MAMVPARRPPYASRNTQPALQQHRHGSADTV